MLDIRDHGGVFGGRSPNLKPENIKKGIIISGVTGSFNGYASISAGSNILSQFSGSVSKGPSSTTQYITIWSSIVNVGGSVRLSTTVSLGSTENAIVYQYFVNETPVGSETTLSGYSSLPFTMTLDATIPTGATVSLRAKKAYSGTTTSQTITSARVSIAEPLIASQISI